MNGSSRPWFWRARAAPLGWLAWLVVALVVAVLLSITLRPGGDSRGIILIPFLHLRPSVACLLHSCRWAKLAGMLLLVNVGGNLALFVPFGVALAVATLPSRGEGEVGRYFGSRWWLQIVVAGFLFSASIELAQLLIPGRTTSADDVILNTLGTAVGAAIVWGIHRRRWVTNNE
jgi:glycopeptide antibiotics resistance protein